MRQKYYLLIIILNKIILSKSGKINIKHLFFLINNVLSIQCEELIQMMTK